MVQLATVYPQGSLTKYQIAEAEAISPGYVQQLTMALRLAGLVVSVRGREGGFKLARAPQDITVADVLRAVEGDIMPAPCRVPGHCNRADTCPTRPIWDRAAALLEELFTSTTIADLAPGSCSA